MSPQEVRDLRRELKLTGKRLAEKLGVEPSLVFDWEKGARFPTKRHCDAMIALRRGAAPAPTPTGAGASTWARLADPELWTIVRKLASSEELLAEVRGLADRYPDPADGG